MLAGRIMPALVSTSAMITGCVSAEIYKYVQGFDDIESYKTAASIWPSHFSCSPSPSL